MKGVIYFLSFLLTMTYISCGQSIYKTKPLKESVNNNNATNVTRYLNEEKWNKLFPNRYGIGLKDSINNNSDFYSFKTFVAVAKIFPSFLQMAMILHRNGNLQHFLLILPRRQAVDGKLD
jgi:basic endochitinase B